MSDFDNNRMDSLKLPYVKVLVASVGKDSLMYERMRVVSILWAENVCAEYSQQQPNPDDCAEDTVPLSDLTSFLRGKGAILYCTCGLRVCCRVGGDG